MTSRFPATPTIFCVTDVGSTTTKTILFKKEDAWRFFREEAATTVEKPHADVTIGVVRAMRALEKSAGMKLLANGAPSVPYLSTSSAGGGLAMVVTGLVKEITAESADRVALGAGALVLDVIAMDDGRTPYQKIEDLKTLRPDMILLAGGFDGDAVTGPVFLAELIVESGLHPKLNPKAELAVIYGGNVNAQEYVRETLSGRFLFHPVPNIRPVGNRENLEPARNAIHDLFMDHVMSQAPGYEQLKSWVSSPIRPTPAAFGRILELISKEMGLRILAVDIGGATTDVFTAEKGELFRTVSANLGMSYSIRNVVDLCGTDAIRQLLDTAISDETLLDRIGNKHIHPTRLPESREEMEIEWAAATRAIREAVRAHLAVMDHVAISLGKSDLGFRSLLWSQRTGRNPREEIPSLPGYDLIIGSGGILSHSPRGAAAMMLVDALQPNGVVEIAVDSAFMFPHLGVLADVDPDLARELFFTLGIVRLGTLVAPTGSTSSPRSCEITGTTSDGREIRVMVAPGEVARIPLAESEKLALSRAIPIGGGSAAGPLRGGVCGLIVDARSRPIHARASSLLDGVSPPPARRTERTTEERVHRGPIRLRRELAIPGEVSVKAGEAVAPDTLLARSVRRFLRPFFLMVAQSIDSPPEDLQNYLLVRIGDEISAGQVIAKRSRKGLIPKSFRSPVDGRLERILPGGILVIREKPELARELTTVLAAKELGIKVRDLKRFLRCEVGQEVERGQWLACLSATKQGPTCKSPVRGRVRRIDLDFGLIMIEPLLEELDILAWLPGTVEDVTDKGCVISNEGVVIYGAWGAGGETFGELTTREAEKGQIEVRHFADGGDLRRLRETGAAGVIAGGVHLKDVLDPNPGFTIVVTDGFAASEIAADVHELLGAHRGKLALIDGTTQLRVGVQRPKIILPRS